MLTPSFNTVTFKNTFTTVIAVTDSLGNPILDTPSVTVSFVDPGVTVTTSTASVTISGEYTAIIPITWYWLDLNYEQETSTVPPSVGTYTKVYKVESPPTLTTDCNYTITSSEGIEVFVQTVTLGSYSTIASELQTVLAGAT